MLRSSGGDARKPEKVLAVSEFEGVTVLRSVAAIASIL